MFDEDGSVSEYVTRPSKKYFDNVILQVTSSLLLVVVVIPDGDDDDDDDDTNDSNNEVERSPRRAKRLSAASRTLHDVTVFLFSDVVVIMKR